MAATMTKLPSDSFWPSGAIETDMRLPFPTIASDSSSIISPLTLPRGAVGYFDQVSLRGNTTSQLGPATLNGPAGAYSPLSPGVRGPALQQQSFLSPHLQPVQNHQLDQYRSGSLPPQSRTSVTSPTGQEYSLRSDGSPHGASFNAPMSPSGPGPAGHPRSISADPNSGPSQVQMIRRLIQQNGRIREAWEAERKYMEANRERAEEVYKEERALMEEERAEWEAEKDILLEEIQRLQQQLLNGGGTSAPFSNTGLRGGGAWESSPESMRSSQSSQSNGHSIQRGDRSSVPAASYNRHYTSLPYLRTQFGHSGRGAGKTLEPLPERISIGPVIPSSGLSPVSAPASDAGNTSPVPIVDVQEIIPELEGIPIKATAIERPTFKDPPSQDGSKASSRSTSPTNTSDEPKRVSKEQTLQVLAVHESARLTMHAGHTPSHSLSLLTTVASSGAATATSSSGESTPTVQQGYGTIRAPGGVNEAQDIIQSSDEPFEAHSEPTLEDIDSRQLRGPLMVRNMPAHDEIFFQRLSDKLEEVSKDRDAALPAVLKDAVEHVGNASEVSSQQTKPEGGEDLSLNYIRDDASSCDSATEKDRSDSPKSGDEEFDIPLRIKKSSNFGAPFGVFR